MAFGIRLFPKDEQFFELFNKMADEIKSAANLLEQLLATDPPDVSKVDPIKDAEHRCDALTHDTYVDMFPDPPFTAAGAACAAGNLLSKSYGTPAPWTMEMFLGLNDEWVGGTNVRWPVVATVLCHTVRCDSEACSDSPAPSEVVGSPPQTPSTHHLSRSPTADCPASMP